MKYFSVESSDISVPNEWMDDPVRLLKVSWKGKTHHRLQPIFSSLLRLSGDYTVGGCCYERKTDQRPPLPPIHYRRERLLLHLPDVCGWPV